MTEKSIDLIAEFRKNWKNFILIILSPPFLFSLIFTVTFFHLSSTKPDQTSTSLLLLLLTISSSIAGAIFVKKWDDLSETQIIKVRGEIAVRNLKLFLENSIILENRVSEYLKRYNEDKQKVNITSEVIKTYFEEIIAGCVSIEEKIINSIVDWKDYVSEANIDPMIEEIRERKTRIENEPSPLNSESSLQFKQYLQTMALDLGIPSVSGSYVTGGTANINNFLSSDAPDNSYLTQSFWTSAAKINEEPLNSHNDTNDRKTNSNNPKTSPKLGVSGSKRQNKNQNKHKKSRRT